MSEEDKPAEQEGFSSGTITFAFSLFGLCMLLLTPTIYKSMNAVPRVDVKAGPQSGVATYYTVESPSDCGTELSDSDLVAGVGKKYWKKPNPKNDLLCQTQAKVTYSGGKKSKSVTVLIQDKCMTCKPGDIALSPAAFKSLAKDLELGSIPVTWDLLA